MKNVYFAHNINKNESGNAFVYVLIAVVLFAALYMMLGSMGGGNSKTGLVSAEKQKLLASEILSYASQAKNSVDYMLMAGIEPEDITFYTDSDPEFSNDTVPYIYMLHHPQGGGLDIGHLPEKTKNGDAGESGQATGWYIGKFNNIEWSSSTDHDIVAVAYNITEDICKIINKTLAGDETIPAMDGEARKFFVDSAQTACTSCLKKSDYCLSDSTGNYFVYYSILSDM